MSDELQRLATYLKQLKRFQESTLTDAHIFLPITVFIVAEDQKGQPLYPGGPLRRKPFLLRAFLPEGAIGYFDGEEIRLSFESEPRPVLNRPVRVAKDS